MALTLFLVMITWVFSAAKHSRRDGIPRRSSRGWLDDSNEIFLRNDINMVYAMAAAGAAVVFLPLVNFSRLEKWLAQNRAPRGVRAAVFIFVRGADGDKHLPSFPLFPVLGGHEEAIQAWKNS